MWRASCEHARTTRKRHSVWMHHIYMHTTARELAPHLEAVCIYLTALSLSLSLYVFFFFFRCKSVEGGEITPRSMMMTSRLINDWEIEKENNNNNNQIFCIKKNGKGAHHTDIHRRLIRWMLAFVPRLVKENKNHNNNSVAGRCGSSQPDKQRHLST